MKTNKFFRILAALALSIVTPIATFASDATINGLAPGIINDQRYNRAIHIMAMLLIGFGFLMVFVRKYVRSALTATFLLVSTALPIYIFSKGMGFLGEVHSEIDRLILA